MLAYKFLARDGHSPFMATAWQQDQWLEAERAVPCREGVHACAADDVAWWLAAELWEIELDGPIERSRHKVVASRGRLVRRLDDYPAAVRELGELSAWRTRDRALVALTTAGLAGNEAHARLSRASTVVELRGLRRWLFEQLDQDTTVGALATLAADAAHLLEYGEPSEPPFVACCAAGLFATGDIADRTTYDNAYDAERRFQSAWLTACLPLS